MAAVEALRAEAEAKVQTTPAWQAAKAAADAAEAIATEAEKKAAASEAELGAKKKPYDGDPLFTYLWRAQFGTSEYQAGNLARMLDRIVADFIGFADARANYAALIEIPLRLREHASAKRAATDERQTALVGHRATRDGGGGCRRQGTGAGRGPPQAGGGRRHCGEEARRFCNKIDAERKALLGGGTDPAYNEALETIAAADSKDDLATLYQEARRTATGADEAIVRRLESIDASVGKVDAEIAGLRKSAQDLARRRLEVEQVRDRFRSAGYDHPNATFGNEMDIAQVLKRIARRRRAQRRAVGHPARRLRLPGAARPSRFRRRDFPFPFPIPGGGTIGSPGGGWREPASRGGWSPDPSSDGGGRDDDERFTTGGSF